MCNGTTAMERDPTTAARYEDGKIYNAGEAPSDKAAAAGTARKKVTQSRDPSRALMPQRAWGGFGGGNTTGARASIGATRGTVLGG